jgi:hypothetical protein
MSDHTHPDYDPLCPRCVQEAANAGFRGSAPPAEALGRAEGADTVTCPNCGHRFQPGESSPAVRTTEV